MNFRNCSVMEIMLLLLLLLDSKSLILSDKRILKRVKRLSTPEFDKNRTLELAKYVVSIRSRTPRMYFGDDHYCGGSIIAPTFVLTAGHCVMEKNKIKHYSRELLVVAGTPNRLKFVTNKSVNMPVTKIFVPTNFTRQNTNNIALLQMQHAWPTGNPRIGIIKLPSSQPIYNINYTVLGWGRVFKGGPLAANIMHIDVILMERSNCTCMLNTFKEEMLCAGNPDVKYDQNPCSGDTGGPMMINDTVYGVATYRLGCGSQRLPSVYTDVWYHMDWINSIIQNAARIVVPKLTVAQVTWFSVSVLILI